ncbi:DUF1194 domain-containing protein [Stappia sp. F7233]|uniref:DUF1194 domain-containing protein n=1 Tax=Stappia albiluteola TaxID=2758565 RepID=A0A839ACL8_9HYPH|nr:DUF1194 domain-containing protein [Stappia albiluteola]MBA5776409.1 DUF1194 domain-containing protein [Stappia albiluteola]
MTYSTRKAVAIALSAALLGHGGPAAAQSCRLALTLALDASASVDAEEHALQSMGLASALDDSDVRHAILSLGGIWLSAFEWSGRNQQIVHVDWTFLDNHDAIDAVSARFAEVPRQHFEFPTAMGFALGFASVQMRNAPQTCARRVIDVSGDGVNNEGFPPRAAYREFDFDGVTINGLVIKSAEAGAEDYYRAEVLRGPDAFLEVAENYGDYARAMKRKLLREIRGDQVSDLRAR